MHTIYIYMCVCVCAAVVDIIIGPIQTGQWTGRSTTVSSCVRHNIELSAHHDHCSCNNKKILIT